MNLSSAENTPPTVTPQMRTVLSYIENNGGITDGEVETLLSVKKTRAFNLMKQMRELGLVYADGRGKNKRYLPVG